MLTIKNLSLNINSNFQLDNINLDIPCGKICALIGPNGAGKTSLIKVITGIYSNFNGDCFLGNMKTTSKEFKKYLGYMPENPIVLYNFTSKEFIEYIYSIKISAFGKNEKYKDLFNMDELVNLFKLEQSLNKQMQHLSQGQLKKVMLMTSLIGDPKIIVLDEPTNGLDTEGILNLKKILNILKNKSKIVLISSHILDFIESIYDISIFINDGKIIELVNKNENLEKVYIRNYIENHDKNS